MFGSLKLPFRRKQAQDLPSLPELNGSKTANHLSSRPRMGETYPNVRHLAVNLVISAPDHETEPTMNGRSFGPQALAYFEFRCKNVECSAGGFDIADSVESAISAGDTEVTGRRVCRGWHGKSRVNQLRCHYELNFKLNISYDQPRR